MAPRFMPLQAGTHVTSPFGPRAGGFHGGTDFGKTGGSAGLPVYACQSGTVIHSGAASGYGGPDPAGWLVIDSDDDQGAGCVEYGHIIREVAKGAKVTAGQRIGRINPSSKTNGGVAPHLHLTVWAREYGGTRIDPMSWLRGSPHPGTPTTPAAPKPTTPGAPAMAPDYGITHTIFGYNAGSAGTGNSNGRRPRTDFAAAHTQEGGTGDAIGLARYCIGAQVGYNVIVDDERTVLNVPNVEGSWSAADANNIAWHLCFAGSYAAWSAGRWLSRDASDGLNEDAMLWRGAKAFAAACLEFKIPVEWVGAVVYANNNWPPKRGICGHVSFGQRGGGHTDPGRGFPVAEFIRRVQSFMRSAVAPAPINLIEAEAKVAHAWIGKRLRDAGQKGEVPLLDEGVKVGAFVPYENAHIYWKMGAKLAYAIPHGGLFEAFDERGFETGIGFPVLRHQVVTAHGITGGVQSFELGVLMTPAGGPSAGCLVHGEIGKVYAAQGWEQGALGWPKSDEYPYPQMGEGCIRQDFTGSSLVYTPTGVVTVAA